MLILAGLGNPGPKYERNRHNIGFLCVDEMASRWRFGPWRTKFQSEVCEGNIQTPAGEVRALLMKPQTYMNESGRAILAAAKFYKSPLDQVVVFHDEMDLAPGRFRMKTGGGAAGHNGLRSIIGQMGPNFRRARMGVGHPGDKDMVLGWVLSDFNKVDGPWVETLCRACADAAPLLAATEDEKYQTEVMRLAPSPKADPRKAGLSEGAKPAN